MLFMFRQCTLTAFIWFIIYMNVNDVLNAKPGKLRLSVIYDCEKVHFKIICKKSKRRMTKQCVWGGGGGGGSQTRALFFFYKVI